MQEIKLWEGSACPLCETQGIHSKLKFFRLNLRVAALLCNRKKCPFPLSTNYPDTFVRVGQDGRIIPGSQSEKGWEHEKEDESDDSPYISDASEESVTFPDIVPEIKKLHDVSSENTNTAEASKVDAFDISNIDFETEDSLDTFKLQNEITSLEMEITKTVENMKSVPLHDNCKGSTMLDSNNENGKTPGSVAVKAFTSSNDNVCSDTHSPLDISDSSCLKMNENEVEWDDDRKSGNIILRGHDSPTSLSGSLELSKVTEELSNCMQQSEVIIPIYDELLLNNKHADFQKNSNRQCKGGGNSDDAHHSGGSDGVKSIGSSSCNNSNVEKQLDTFSVEDTPNPEPKLLTPQDMRNTLGNDLSRKCGLPSELVTSETVNLNDCGKDEYNILDMDIIFDDCKNSDSIDNKMENERDTCSMADILNLKPKPPILLIPQDTKNTVENDSPGKHELHAELVTSDSVTFKEDNGCDSKKCDNNEMDIIFDDHVNSNCSDNIVEKLPDTFPMADTSNPKPGSSVLLQPQCTKKSVGNDSPRNCELSAEFVTNNSETRKKDNKCSSKKCVYEIVTIDSEASSIPGDSTDYEIINVELRMCEDQESSGDTAGKITTKVRKRAQNTSEQCAMKNSLACSDSEIVAPSVKLKIVEEDGLFVCTANIASSSVLEVEETKNPQETSGRYKAHSKNCVCFLCKETNKKGVTSHLDRELADLFPEEHPVETNSTERDLPTQREIMKDFVHYVTGNSSLQNTKKNRRKRKRLFHL